MVTAYDLSLGFPFLKSITFRIMNLNPFYIDISMTTIWGWFYDQW